MSWQAYIDTSLIGTGKVQHAAILGHDGSVWAASSTLAAFNGKPLVDAFANPAPLRAEGLTINESRYVIIKSDERSIYGKSKEAGFVSVKTKQAVILGIYEAGTVAGDTAKVVEGLADYLISAGY